MFSYQLHSENLYFQYITLILLVFPYNFANIYYESNNKMKINNLQRNRAFNYGKCRLFKQILSFHIKLLKNPIVKEYFYGKIIT